MPKEGSSPGSTLDWLARAKGSLVMAKQTRPEGTFLEDYCFQAQQAAEKALKAVYQHLGVVFRYTHDLEELGAMLEAKGIRVPESVKDAVILSKYAYEGRYPGPYEPVTEEEYREAISLAEVVVVWAESVIQGKPTRPDSGK